jgi:hypothetical protein
MLRGGGPGTRGTDMLQPGRLIEQMHAVVLTGGSVGSVSRVYGTWDGYRSVHVTIIELVERSGGGCRTSVATERPLRERDQREPSRSRFA